MVVIPDQQLMKSKVKGYFDYGYAISVHKSQGSEFDKVLLLNEMPRSFKDYNKWLYTAITRYKKEINNNQKKFTKIKRL